jgi:hypothetical protein
MVVGRPAENLVTFFERPAQVNHYIYLPLARR